MQIQKMQYCETWRCTRAVSNTRRDLFRAGSGNVSGKVVDVTVCLEYTTSNTQAVRV